MIPENYLKNHVYSKWRHYWRRNKKWRYKNIHDNGYYGAIRICSMD